MLFKLCLPFLPCIWCLCIDKMGHGVNTCSFEGYFFAFTGNCWFKVTIIKPVLRDISAQDAWYGHRMHQLLCGLQGYAQYTFNTSYGAQHLCCLWVMHNLLLSICIPPSFCSPLRLGLKTNCSKMVSTVLCLCMLIFMCWHDEKRSNIRVCLFFAGCRVEKDLYFSFMELSFWQGSHLSNELFVLSQQWTVCVEFSGKNL